jgi:hypothetical protein
MERSVLLFVFVVNFLNCFLASQNWTLPQGKIKFVFECERNDKKVELLRLYTSGEYEQIEYLFQPNQPEIVHRNLGTYTINKTKLVINKPTCNEFGSKISSGIYFFKQNLYKSTIDAFLHKKKFLCLKTSKKETKKPFFIGINSDEIVFNNDIEKAFSLETLVQYITKDATDDKAKVMAISKFICRSIEYDHEGLAKNNYAHSQNDIYGILSSKNRVAVCAGYAYVFDSLARIAKVQTREVTGYTKQYYGGYNKLVGLHAWNIVTLVDKDYYIDVTWSDHKKDINMAWMFVDPEMMLGSHFPLKEKDILYKNTFTSDDFKQREVVLARKESAKIKHFPTTSWARIIGNHYLLKFKSKVNIEANWLDPGITEFKYSNEKSGESKSYTYNKIENIKTYFLKDTFCVEIPIPKEEVALNINVSDEYVIRTHIFKGDEIEYCKQLMAKWNKDHIIAFTEGILAAIKIGDTQFLKENLGDKYFALYDKKNQWKLSKDLLANIKKWDGTAQQLDGVNKWRRVNNELVLEEQRFIKYNPTDKVYVKFENNKYELLCIK